MRRLLPPLVATAVLCLAVQSVSPAAASSDVDGTSIRTWNEFAVVNLIGPTAPAPLPGPVGPLYLTYLHRAVYDAVDGLPATASVPAAVAAAAAGVLTRYFPTQATAIGSKRTAELAAIPDGPAETAGVTAGEAAAARLLADRGRDVLTGPPRKVEDAEAGVWTPAPPNTAATADWLAVVRPFVLDSPSQFRPDGPPSLTSNRWARDYEEVRLYGGAGNTAATTIARTPEQTTVGRFWSDPPAVQSQRALRAFSVDEGLDALETARLFALVNTASADALIACADAKFHFNFWRPIAAIPAGDTDGNPRTVDDDAWTALVATPNFPEYPSNHSCATTAIATVVDRLDGPGRFAFTMTSTVTGTTEEFTSRGEMIRHVGNGRVWGGLHYRFSVEDGTDIGRAVAKLVVRDDRHR